MRPGILPLLLTLTIILAACSSAAPALDPPAGTSQAAPQPALVSTEPAQTGAGDMTRTDQQGLVVIEVTPLNLETPGDNLEFNVAMNTHSVDLGLDLASLATLTNDTGITVQATTWEAPSGGHHVSGKLIFPATKDGKSILEGASKLTLAIINVDAASRVFEWELK